MNIKHLLQTASAAALAALLAGCGGDGSSPPPQQQSLTLTGTAATGAAIAGGTVTAKCLAGSHTSVTTEADGHYSLGVVSGSLPCVLQVTSASGAVSLYSVAAGSGSAATSDITPLTHLVVARLAGTDPAAFFSNFDSAAAATVTGPGVTSAQAGVVETLKNAGVDVSAAGDLVTGTLTPATPTASGNAYATALDALQAKLTTTVDGDGQPMSLATLATAVAATTGSTAGTSSKASLPPDRLLQAAASTCSSLRSGVYRLVAPRPGTDLAHQTETATMDAATLGVVYQSGITDTLVPHPTEPCRFTDGTGHADIVVSSAGVLAIRSYDPDTGHYQAAIAFPEQTHTLAELAGTWNTLGLSSDDAGLFVGTTVTGTFNASGAVTGATACGVAGDWNVTTCTTVTSGLPTLSVDPAGGFDDTDPGAMEASGRTFAYRSGSGDLMMVHIDGDASFDLRTPAHANDLPAAGRVSTSWDLRYSNQWLGVSAVSESTSTVQTVDTAAGSYVRLAKTVGGTDDHLETIFVNDPRSGYNFRAAATVLGTDGTTSVNVAEWTNLPLRGMGMNALLRPAQKQFMFSVQQP